jgi:hypothetical protein
MPSINTLFQDFRMPVIRREGLALDDAKRLKQLRASCVLLDLTAWGAIRRTLTNAALLRTARVLTVWQRGCRRVAW